MKCISQPRKTVSLKSWMHTKHIAASDEILSGRWGAYPPGLAIMPYNLAGSWRPGAPRTTLRDRGGVNNKQVANWQPGWYVFTLMLILYALIRYIPALSYSRGEIKLIVWKTLFVPWFSISSLAAVCIVLDWIVTNSMARLRYNL